MSLETRPGEDCCRAPAKPLTEEGIFGELVDRKALGIQHMRILCLLALLALLNGWMTQDRLRAASPSSGSEPRLERKGQTQSPAIPGTRQDPSPPCPAFSSCLCLLIISKRAETSMDLNLSRQQFIYHFLTQGHTLRAGMMQAYLPSEHRAPSKSCAVVFCPRLHSHHWVLQRSAFVYTYSYNPVK